METLIGTPPVAALYYQMMVLVSLVGLIVGATRLQPRRGAPGAVHAARVQVLGLAGVFLLRLAIGVVPSTLRWGLPLERVADMAGLALLAWILVPVLHRGKWAGRVWLAGHGVLCLTYLIVTALADARVVLPIVHYNLALPAYLWTIWQVLTVVAAIIGLAVFVDRRAVDAYSPGVRTETRSLLLIGFGALLIGYDFHLLALAGVSPHYPPPDNVAAWVRCAQLLAYPVLVSALCYPSLSAEAKHRSEP